MFKLLRTHIFHVLSAFLLTVSAPSFADTTSIERHVASIRKMVKAGILNEHEGNEQIGQLRMDEAEAANRESAFEDGPKRGVASTLSKQKIIEFSNQAIEIQVK